MKKKIINYIAERKWLLAISFVLLLAVIALAIRCDYLTKEVGRADIIENVTAAEVKEEEQESKNETTDITDPNTEKTTETTIDVNSLIDENKKLKSMLQNQTDNENLEIDLKTAAIKFIDASYNYDESNTTTEERENVFKSTVTPRYYKKLRPENVGTSAFIMMKGETGAYTIKAVYYADINTDEPKVAVMYTTKINCPLFDEPVENQFFQAFTLAMDDGEWKVDDLVDVTTT